jgi:acetolactate synthase-1/2/3 large subunit
VRFPYGTGTLGFGVPAAVGAKLARPGREVVAVAGDGAFLYNPQELATMLRHGQKLTVIVANDDGYGAIKHNMQERFGRATAHALANPDFVRLGEAFGMRALRLAAPGEVGAALVDALAGEQSTLIEAPLELKPPRRFYE